MKTFILLTKLAPDISRQMKNRDKLGRNWLELVKAKCPEVKFISHYALLGPHDFLDIYEAPDEESAAKVSMIRPSSVDSQIHPAPWPWVLPIVVL